MFEIVEGLNMDGDFLGNIDNCINEKCQVFTPKEYANKLLDTIGYDCDLYGKKVVENSCGDGNILELIVERYIADSIVSKRTIGEIKLGLENDIYGYEIDTNHLNNCILRLHNIAKKYKIYGVKWNIINNDFLKKYSKNTFDFVIGNPPYISYPELNSDIRAFVKDNFSVCEYGKFDYCYAFIQASIFSLNATGKLAYLIPSNIFKTKYAEALRELLKKHITDIYDYTILKLFKDKLTSSAIIVYNKSNNDTFIRYHDMLNNIESTIDKSNLFNKWQFKNNKSRKLGNIRFGNFFHAASGIATLLNEVYIIKEFVIDDNYLCINEDRLELDVVRKAVSPRSLNYNKDEYVIFPYYYDDDGNLNKYSISDFETKFPCTTQYLSKFKERLGKRDVDRSAKWFEYGRSQALAHLYQHKLLISTLITNKVKVYMLDKNTIPTSGLYITSKGNYSLDVAVKILESNEFLEYVESIGVISNSSSFRISSNDLNEYIFDEESWY